MAASATTGVWADGAVQFRPLTSADVDEFRRVRLSGLKESPTAFGSSFEQSETRPLEYFRGVLEISAGDGVVIGAFKGTELVALGGLRREGGTKERHKASIWGIYVQPTARGCGIAGRILTRLVEHAKAMEDLWILRLGVESSNNSAVRLYERFGFQKIGCEPAALRVDGHYDEDFMVLKLRPVSPSSTSGD